MIKFDTNRQIFLKIYVMVHAVFLLFVLVVCMLRNPCWKIAFFIIPAGILFWLWRGVARKDYLVVTIVLWLLLISFVSVLIHLWRQFDILSLILAIFYAVLIYLGRKEYLR